MTLYFVVRTDVTASEGLQRVFGVYDSADAASDFIVELQARYVGTFAVYQGSPA